MNREQVIEAYLDRVLGEQTGYAAYAFGYNPSVDERGRLTHDPPLRDEFVKWPSGRAKLVELILDRSTYADAYVMPGVLTKPRRIRENCAGGRVIFCDVDAPWTPERAALLKPLFGCECFALASGSRDRRHVYLVLNEVQSADLIEHWNHRLSVALGADTSKYPPNSYLRPPATLNHKHSPPSPVRVIERSDASWWVDADMLEVHLAPLTSESNNGHRPGGRRVDPGAVPDLPAYITRMVGEDPGEDRSQQTWKLVATMVECGYADEAIVATALTHAPTIGKWPDHATAITQVVACIDKTRPDHDHIGRWCVEAHCRRAPAWMVRDADDEDHRHHVDDEHDDDDDLDGGRRKPSQATTLVQLATDRYRLGCSLSGEPFAVAVDGPNVARMLRGGRSSLRAELSAAYAAEYRRAPSSSALADAMLVLEGRAMNATREPVALRLSRHDDGVVIDLGDAVGRAVVVRPGAWKVVQPAPVLFRRTELTGALPVPVPGGDLTGLADLLNVHADAWPLLLGWALTALIPDVAHPIVLFTGEQDSGKSTTERLVVRWIDPSSAELRSVGREDDWVVAASGSYMVPLDNVSTIRPWLSDSLCRAVTGDGAVRRTLYADTDLTVISYRRVVAMSSIDPGALRGDLADRLLAVELEPIDPADRLDDEELDQTFRAGHAAWLGALLDLFADVLVRLPQVNLKYRPRMLAFARVLQVLDDIDKTDSTDGIDRTGTLERYVQQGKTVAADVVDADAVASAVLQYVDDHVKSGGWKGSAGDLLRALTPERPPKDWPASPQAMGAILKRAAPALRLLGLTVEYHRDGRSRTWEIKRDAQ